MLTQANNDLHQKKLYIKELEQERAQNTNAVKAKEQAFDEKETIIKDFKEIVAKKDRIILSLEEEHRLKVRSLDQTIEDLKTKQEKLVAEKDVQVQSANAKLEAELKESLERIEVFFKFCL